MKKNSMFWLAMMSLALSFSSCQVIGGIFKAGIWVGVVIVVLVIGLILWLVGRGRS
ncbi:MAG: phosphatidate cytidylyltransferase [Flavisolibacter sp.]